MIDQLRASKLPSNMMQFAARGALQVPPAENIEILVYLAKHNRIFGETARMTLAGWDEKASREAVADPQTAAEVLDYFISADNLRPSLLAALLENPSVSEGQVLKLSASALRDTVEVILKSERVRSMPRVVASLRANPYVRKEEAEELKNGAAPQPAPVASEPAPPVEGVHVAEPAADQKIEASPASTDEHDEVVSSYLKDHSHDIVSEGEKPFQAIGGIVELLGSGYFPVIETAEAQTSAAPTAASAPAAPADTPKPAAPAKKPAEPPKRENALQKISHLDVKGRIQLALKGNKEERSLLIRDGTKVVALAVLDAPKLSDGEVEKIASQKNVLEAVLRQIPLKRRFMKNYIVVRNLVANPRTPLDLGLGLMKNLLAQDLKNISANKEVSETIRKLALKMYKQKLDAANKK
ncbi:MAG: hypothetical protein WAM79_11965 [Candidatus Sulfotelmatobacter sp.]